MELYLGLKNQLCITEFDDDDILLIVLEIIDSFTKEDWFIRIHKCIDAEEQYCEKIHHNQSWSIYPKDW